MKSVAKKQTSNATQSLFFVLKVKITSLKSIKFRTGGLNLLDYYGKYLTMIIAANKG